MDDIQPNSSIKNSDPIEEDEESSTNGSDSRYLHDPNSDSDNDGNVEAEASTSTAPLQSILNRTKPTKKSAWIDPDDATLSVSLAGTRRLRKLRDVPGEDAWKAISNDGGEIKEI